MIVLIPAYEPDARLPGLVTALVRARPDVIPVVVDDGSGPGHAATFDATRAAGAVVLTQPRNLGKGRALRTGIAYAGAAHPGEDVVCADSDGQHTAVDVLRVADHVRRTGSMVLGGRRFDGDVPLRSRFGNAVSRGLLRRASGGSIHDTQTGLRGYPAGSLAWLLEVPGDRFEYELRVLLRAHADGRAVEEIPIQTLYLEGNASSHFRPMVDSGKVLAPLLLHAVVAIGSFLLDLIALWALVAVTGELLVGVIGARLMSGTVAFVANRRLVHHGRGRAHTPPAGTPARRRALLGDALRYAALAALVALGDVLLLEALTAVGIPLLLARIGAGAALFVAGFAVQRTLVFRRHAVDPGPGPAAVDAVTAPPAASGQRPASSGFMAGP
ncbi:glycosyltransferase family 2 protein [Clavibacter sp. MX14-G9D]|uniref:glycosyltransferase family 2 protein n=1 Tax=Clavibacter sp. MX14-G9D TaxID=3064656 RepID=UPI00293E1F59|nr:glycosyltransferase family 2 protein [Clavibacter sp. MX14-G9D]